MWAGQRAPSVKITASSIPNGINYCAIFLVYMHIIYKYGRGKHENMVGHMRPAGRGLATHKQQILYVLTRLTRDDAASTQRSISASECSHSDIQENHGKNGNELVISVSDVCYVTPVEGHTFTRKPTD